MDPGAGSDFGSGLDTDGFSDFWSGFDTGAFTVFRSGLAPEAFSAGLDRLPGGRPTGRFSTTGRGELATTLRKYECY